MSTTWMSLEMQEGSLMGGFPHDDISDRQSFHMMPSTLSSATLDISPMETMPKSDVLGVPESQPEWQNPTESFVDPVDDDRSSEFVQYLDETSMCQDDQSENDGCSVLYDGLEQTGRDQPCVDTGNTNHQAMQISRDSSVDLGHSGVPHTNDVADEQSPILAEVGNLPTRACPETTSSGSTTDSESDDSAIGTQVEQMEISQTTVDTSDIINDDNKAFDFIKALKEKGMLPDLLEKLGYPSLQSTTSDITTTPSVHSNTNENNFKCQEEGCNKSFTRPCELKCVCQRHHNRRFTDQSTRKHEKRHVKPYACTFQFCDKKFGSKNDWKRHENSQHYQHELWRCNEKTGLNEECGKTCHRREQFRSHLAKEHSITGPTVDTKLEQCLKGQDFDARYWCGFCERLIQVEEKGLKAWTNRFDHIDDHFSGRRRPKMDISQWKHQDVVQTELNAQSRISTAGSSNGRSAVFAPTSALGPRRASKPTKRPATDEGHHQSSRKRGRVLFYCASTLSRLASFSRC